LSLGREGGTLALFAEFFIDSLIEPLGFCYAFVAQPFLEAFHFLTLNLNSKRFEFFTPLFEVIGPAIRCQIVHPLLLRATLYHVTGNKSRGFLRISFSPPVGFGGYLCPHGCPHEYAGSWAAHSLLGGAKAGGSSPRLKAHPLENVVQER